MVLVFKTSDLPGNSEEAFAIYEERAREAYEERIPADRNQNSDHNGNYEGSFEPERSYVTAILAFLDEHTIEANIEDISELDNKDFFSNFGRFKAKVEYISTRFRLRKERLASGSIGMAITFQSNYKNEIGSLLEKIRKIINQEVSAGAKKEKIFKRIAELQSEIDRDVTTVDAVFGRMIDLTRTIGECTGNLKPAIDQIERIKKIFWDNSERVDALPKPDRPKLISKADEPRGFEAGEDDEIPF